MPTNIMTRAAARFEVKALDDGARTFRGLASTWDLDLGGDVIHRGAFARTLDHWRRGGKLIPLIDQHNYGSVRAVVGKMTAADETEAGLEAEFAVIDGPDGDEVYRRIKGGFIDSLSIGYEAVQWDIAEDVRHLREVKLYEVSAVIWPMNPGATIDGASVKALLQSAGLTKEQVLALLTDEAPPAPAADDPAPTPEDAEPAGLAPEAMDALKARILDLQIRSLGLSATRGR